MQVLVDAGVHLQTGGGRQDEVQRINNSTMQMILLDSNIYDKLRSDENTRLRLASLILLKFTLNTFGERPVRPAPALLVRPPAT